MLRLISTTGCALALALTGMSFLAVKPKLAGPPLAEIQPGKRIIMADMQVFSPVTDPSAPAGYIDGRPIPSGVRMPIVLDVKTGEATSVPNREPAHEQTVAR